MLEFSSHVVGDLEVGALVAGGPGDLDDCFGALEEETGDFVTGVPGDLVAFGALVSGTLVCFGGGALVGGPGDLVAFGALGGVGASGALEEEKGALGALEEENGCWTLGEDEITRQEEISVSSFLKGAPDPPPRLTLSSPTYNS